MFRYMSLAVAIVLSLRACNVWAGPISPEFTPPINLGSGVNTAHLEGFPGISSDGLTLFFPSDRPGGEGSRSIWQATRESLADPFGTPTNVVAANSPYREFSPKLSADGLALFFGSTRPGAGGSDIWQTTRSSTNDPFGVATIVESVNTTNNEDSPCLSADGLTLFFKSNRSGGVGGYDIWYATRSAVTEAFDVPANLGSAVNSPFEDGGPSISADGLTLYFDSARPGGVGSYSLWMTTRDSVGEPFGEPVSLGSIVNTRLCLKTGLPRRVRLCDPTVGASTRHGGRENDAFVADG